MARIDERVGASGGTRVFKTKRFARLAGGEIDDETLREAARRASQGVIDADLGGGVVKLRIARRGQGKSRSFRVIVLFRFGERMIFAYVFSKSAKSNLREDELRAYRQLADTMLKWSDGELATALDRGSLIEIVRGGGDGE